MRPKQQRTFKQPVSPSEAHLVCRPDTSVVDDRAYTALCLAFDIKPETFYSSNTPTKYLHIPRSKPCQYAVRTLVSWRTGKHSACLACFPTARRMCTLNSDFRMNIAAFIVFRSTKTSGSVAAPRHCNAQHSYSWPHSSIDPFMCLRPKQLCTYV